MTGAVMFQDISAVMTGQAQASSPDRTSLLRGNIAMLITVFVWGSQRPITDLLLRDYDSWQLSLWRNWFALPFMILLFASPFFRGWKLPEGNRLKLFVQVMLLGCLASIGFGVLNTFGVEFAGPIQTAIVGCATPLIAAAVAWVVKGSRPDKSLSLALAFVVTGAMVAIFGGGREFSGSGRAAETLIIGGVMIIAATVCWQLYSIKAQDWLTGWNQKQITGGPLTLGALQLTLFCWLFGDTGFTVFPPPLPKDWAQAGLFLYVAMGSIVIGTVAWNYGVKTLGPVVAAIYLNLAPIISIGLAVILGSPLHLAEVIGGVIVLGGVIITQRQAWKKRT